VRLIIKNGRVITPLKKIDNGGIAIENGKIIAILEEGDDISRFKKDIVLDVRGG